MLLGAMLVALLTLSVATLPYWPFSREWGYAPSAISTTLLVALIGLVRTGVFV
ncbi:MAG: DUF3309 family protein [Gemmatimonadota bacterium]|nr:DUF3309 family protein [Gemmatimonadota bacterium]